MRYKLAAVLSLLFLAPATVRTLQAEGDDDCCNTSRAVYVMTNQAVNAVMVFNRAPDGGLSPAGMFPTGGSGFPAGNPFDPLGSENSLILSPDGHLLFAVNAGSNEISVLRAGPNGLTLVSKAASGGQMPTSLTLNGDLLYVLNAGGVPNITGFVVSHDGTLSPLPGSTRPLAGGAAAGPAQVGFNPDGDVLVVTEKMTNIIDTYIVGEDGLATGPTAHNSSGIEPFGFAFTRGDILIDSEAFQGAPQQAAASSYRVSGDGSLQVVSGSVHDHQTAACWTVVSKGGRFAYVTNTASFVISGYKVSGDGTLTLLNSDGVTAATGPASFPIDMAVTRSGRFLYVILAGAHTVVGYRIEPDGALVQVASAGGLPVAAQGIAAR